MNRINEFVLKLLSPAFIFALVLCVLRIHGEKGIFFQAIAHCYVTWFFAGAYYTKDKWFLFIGVAMSVVETLCFLRSH